MSLLIGIVLVLAALAVYFALAGADTLTAEFHLTGNALYSKGLANRQAQESFQIGQNAFPALDTTYTTGNGTLQVQRYFCTTYTINAGANQDIDLTGVLVDDLGQTIANAVVKEILVALDAPDGTVKVRVGPQGVTNPFIGPWTGGQGATVYEDVYVAQRWSQPYAGWTVTAGTGDILRINNPGGAAVTIHVVVLGG